jgi:signal transduction histidine kinase
MLTGLLIQWLRSQWRDEKASLQKDINLKFMESVNQVMDSTLVKHLILPVMNDSSLNNENLLIFNKKLPPGKNEAERRMTAFYNDSGGHKQTMVTITLPGEKGTRAEDVAFSAYDSTEKKMLLRSVKLIIRHTGDSVGKWNRLNHIISIASDTILLKNLFEKKLEKQRSGLNIIWRSDTAKNRSDSKNPVMHFTTELFEKPLNVEVLHYQRVLLKSISAQILFALSLFIITSAAFFFTYRNLKKQEALNILRNDFISNISHELKTPVSTVSVALEVLKNFEMVSDPEKSNEYLEIAQNEMKRLDQLITQVLNTSILEDNREYLLLKDTDLVDLTREVLSSLQTRFIQSGAKVELSVKPEVITLNLDKLHIQGVLLNLLDNSLKYRSEQPHIFINIEEKSSYVHLKISDNGPGIPKEYISKIFDKFFRVPMGDTHNIKGYGLGLSYAYLVMKHHSGSIEVKNMNEGGCEFTLTFPFKKQ